MNDNLQKRFSNKLAYDANQLTEKQSAVWLKTKKRLVNRAINLVATIGIINGLLVIVQSALLAIIFDQIIIQHQFWLEIINLFLILAVVFLLRAISSYYFQTLGFQIAVRIKRSVRSELLEKFRQLGPSYVHQHQSGELAAATLEHTEALDGYFAHYLPQQVIVSVLPVLMILIVLPINWVVAIIFCITGPLIPVFMILVGMGAESANRSQFLEMTRMQGYFFDRLQGISTLKLFSQAEKEVTRISAVASAFREKTMRVLRIAFLSSAVLEFFSAVAVALVAVYVGLGLLGLINFGPAINISLQEALFVLLLAPEFFSPLKQLAAYYHEKAAAIAASDHILLILQQPNTNELMQQPIYSKYCIELKNVYKSYQQKQVLKDLNLQIKTGERIALIGRSGAGKTTLFKLLLGFEPVSNGIVLINGQTANIETSANNIAWAGQHGSIFNNTLAANISLLNTDISHQQIEAVAKAVGITEFSQQLELGLKTLIGEKGAGYSGGQAQRIGLARALLKDAPIILLDEPTAHLDQSSKTGLLDEIDQWCKDKTLIIAAHDPVIIARMDRVVNLS